MSKFFHQPNTFYQFNTSQILCQGILESTINASALPEIGNFCFGATEGMKDNIVIYDGELISPQKDKPVAICFLADFIPEQIFRFNEKKSLNEIRSFVESHFKSNNLIYMFVLKSYFESVEISHFPSFEKPYPAITPEIVNQSENEIFHDIHGLLMGFWLPGFFDGVNSGSGGLHIHFLSQDKQVHGHVLNCGVHGGEVELCHKHNFEIIFPDQIQEYQSMPMLNRDNMNERISDWAKKGKGGISCAKP